MNTIIKAENVSKRFPQPHKPDAVVVNGVTLTLAKGEVFGLIGQNGSGKTTLARILLRLETPSTGKVFFQGQEITRATPAELKQHVRRKTRMLYQHPDAALNPAFTISMIIDQALEEYTKLDKKGRRAKMHDLLKMVSLSERVLEHYPYQLSRGQKRRVSICRALATQPTLLVADEPFSGLDVALQGQILDVLLRWRREHHATLLLISHDIGLVRKACDRIGVMYAGKLVEVGTRSAVTPEMCRHPYTRSLFKAQVTLSSSIVFTRAESAKSGVGADAGAERGVGCPYRPSCALWTETNKPDRCMTAPEMMSIGEAEAHRVACHFA